MNGIELLVEKKQLNYKENGTAAFLCLLSGVYGIVLLLRSVSGISYAEWLVYPAGAVACGILWLVYHRKRSWFPMVFIGLLAAEGLGIYMLRDTLMGQVAAIADSLSGNSGQETVMVTEAVCLGILFLSLLLFFLEMLLKNHMLLYLVTSALLLAAPLFGIRPGIGSLVLLVFFQIAFWSLRLIEKGRYRLLFPENGQKRLSWKICRVVLLLMGVGFLISFMLVSRYEEDFYDLAYKAEGSIYQITSQVSGQSENPIANGLVSSGNNYATGTDQLQVTVSRRPTETLYLKGFTGGDYVGGDWLPADDEQVYIDMDQVLHWREWASMIGGMYSSMYYVLNRTTQTETEPVIMAVQHVNQDYRTLYTPYYSRRSRGWNNSMATGENTDYSLGYFYWYFEQKDMNVQWEVPAGDNGMMMGWYGDLQNAYREAAGTAYTKVPWELLPRLAELARQHPLEELNEITEFILYTLQSNAVYTRTPGWAPLNEDIVEYFLFESGKGYCVHFASAATLLYRMYGVPSRYASGYVLYPSDFELQEDGTYRAVVTDASAHAWTEILLDDYGWTPLEVTPASDGSSAAVYPGFDGLDLERLSQMQEEWSLELPEESGAETEQRPVRAAQTMALSIPEIHLESLGSLGEILLLSAAYLLFLAPVFLDCRRSRRMRRLEQMSACKVFGRFMEMLHFSGYLKGYEGTEDDFAGELARKIPGVTVKEISRMQELAMEAAYGAGKTADKSNRELVKTYRKAAEEIYGKLRWHQKLIFRYGKAFG